METPSLLPALLEGSQSRAQLPPESTELPGTKMWAHTTKQEVLASQTRSSGVVPSMPASLLHLEGAPTWSKSS